jgi:CBS domain-containing protein
MTTTPTSSGRRSISSIRRTSSASKKPVLQSEESESGSGSINENTSKPDSPLAQPVSDGERTVKKLRLSKALTINEGTTVFDACRRMAARRVDAVLLTDSSALLSGIVTDKDIATRVIAEGLRPEHTLVSKVMTRNPIFVTSDSLAIEALQKMVQGKFRHLPVVENGEVIALLDITKCLYDAISRMEKAAEQGSALATAVEERHWGSGNFAFIDTLRERMFKPALSTIVTENTKVALVSASDPVFVASKKMRDLRVNSVIIAVGNKIHGILTSKPVFNNLKTLGIKSEEGRGWQAVPALLRNCPHLEYLIIEGLLHNVTDKCGDACDCISREDKGRSLASCPVKKVEIQGFRGTMREINMIGHFLRSFKCLKEMGIFPEEEGPTNFENPGAFEYVEKILKLYNEISNCDVYFLVWGYMRRKWTTQ